MQEAISSSGDPMERDRHVLLEQQNSSATKIQKYFRRKKAVQLKRLEVRENFCSTFGGVLQNVDWKHYGVDSDFLHQFLFFFDAKEDKDIDILCQLCDLLLQYVKFEGNVVSLFAGVDYSVEPVVIHRVKKLVLICVHVVHQKRFHWGSQLLMSSKSTTMPFVQLLETVACLINPKLPWNCKVVGYLQQKKIYCLLRGVIIALPQNARDMEHLDCSSPLNEVLTLVASHVGNHPCCCAIVDPRWSFSSQLLSIPFLWHRLPHFKKVFYANGLSTYYIHQIAFLLSSCADVLPNDISANQPGYVCVLGNVLESATLILSEPKFSSDRAADIIAVCTSLLDVLPKIASPTEMADDDDAKPMDVDVKNGLDVDLQRQITAAFDSSPRLLGQLVNAIVRGTLSTDYSDPVGPSGVEMEAVGSLCAFLHVMVNTFHPYGIMTVLAYHTEIVPALWNFIKRCHENKRWQSFSKCVSSWPADAPGWLLPVSVFCPIYKHTLEIVDKDEFYEQEKPFSLEDLKSLILILKEALWELLWIIPSHTSPTQTTLPNHFCLKKMSIENLKSRARIGLSELLIQMQDWNNRCPFTSASDFCSQECTSENFVAQAILVNTRESQIIKIAPFLVPFDIRAKIFTTYLANSRQLLTSSRLEVRRARLLEDAFDKLSMLSQEDLKGQIQVSFVDEHGLEEAGIDVNGIFQDFMENVTRDAFNVQYGLFKETADHMLYPNPRSRLVHERHLQYFYFLGCLLGKAMYEGIHVGSPFAPFFLRKLKQKSTTLNDLISLDPVSYEHLLQLKRYEGKLLDLGLHFVAMNNENGEQSEELLPGGREKRVSNHNVIMYIHLVANHQLNYQIRGQSTHFLRGFQQLIPKEWIDMFDEHEIQILISGSPNGLDVDDLRSNTSYAG